MATRVIRMADKTASAPYVTQIGTVHYLSRYRLHDFVDIIAVIAGEGWQTSYPDGVARVRHLTRGRMMLYRPSDELVLRGRSPDGLTMCCVSFPVSEWRIFAGLVGVDPAWSTRGEPPSGEFDPEDPGALRAFDVVGERFRTAPTPLDLVQFWAATIPVLFPDYGRRRPGAGAPAWLTRSVDAMHEEENLRGGVARLVQLSHVTPAYLAATMRRYFGTTPTKLVNAVRLQHAALLLRTTRVPVAEIAQRCGFSSSAYFSTAFGKEHGLAPRDYRARNVAVVGQAPPS